MNTAAWSSQLDEVPRGSMARSVSAVADRHDGVESLRLRLDEEVEWNGVAGVDYVDQPTFLVLPVHFTTGRIEVSVAAETHADAPDYARGFAGIAFGIDDESGTFECAYIRPLNGVALAPPAPRNRRAVQYFAYPDWPFDVLRERWPDGSHEAAADVRPGMWHHLTVSVAEDRVVVEVDGATAVDVARLHGPRTTGAIGLWVDIGTRAWFADLRVSGAHER